MTYARRLAGARKPAPSAGSPSRPDPRHGRRRARLSRLLPALALLLGAISLFAGPAQAQTPITVSLSAEQTTINEGEQVVLRATTTPELTLEEARARGIALPVEFPLELFRDTSEPGDVRLPATIVLGPRAGNLVHVYAAHDADTDDEQFLVSLDSTPPAGFRRGSAHFVSLTIKDDDAPPRTQQPVPPVTNLAVRPGNGQLNLTWTNPTVDYVPLVEVRWRLQGASDWERPLGGPSITSARIPGLRNGRTYEVEVVVLNEEDVASRPVSATGTPFNLADSVRLNVQVTPGDRRLTLRWTRTPAPRASEGPGSYDVQYREKYTCYVDMSQGRPRYVDNVPQYVCNEWGSDGPGWFSHGSGPDNRGTTRVINGLTPGTEYEVRVRRGGSQTNNWFYATGRTPGSTNPRLRALQLNTGG